MCAAGPAKADGNGVMYQTRLPRWPELPTHETVDRLAATLRDGNADERRRCAEMILDYGSKPRVPFWKRLLRRVSWR